ncbi:hypothetical protein GCM10010199_48530 [Dactylosporangium roseum]
MLVRPTQLYMVSLALTGLGSLGTVVLPAGERGDLAASIVSATLGASIGGFSVDTFLLSRPSGWVVNRGRWWILLILVGCVLASSGVAVALTAAGGIGSYSIAVCGAAALTVFNACASLMLRIERFAYVYAMRSLGGAVLIAGYAALYLAGNRSGDQWSDAWLASQVLAAITLVIPVLRRARGFGLGPDGQPAADYSAAGRTKDLTAIGKLHVGIAAQMFTFRLNQIILARFAGAGPLGVYALAVAALEFAQSSAVITAQKILADRGNTDEQAAATPVVKAAPIVKATLTLGVLAVVGLAALGLLKPDYSQAALLGMILLPGAVAVALGKAWSAALLKQGGEQATTNVALIALAVAVPSYVILIPWIGAVGAAAASSFAYAVHAYGSFVSLKKRKRQTLLAHGMA